MYYSGNDCEIKSEYLKIIETTIKSTTIVAIVIFSLSFSLFPLNDLMNIFTKTNLKKKTSKVKKQPIIKMKIKVQKLYYRP